jgi:hypothetical protein
MTLNQRLNNTEVWHWIFDNVESTLKLCWILMLNFDDLEATLKQRWIFRLTFIYVEFWQRWFNVENMLFDVAIKYQR